jgi:hypothetical protein
LFTEISNGQDPATAKPKDAGEKNPSNVLISVTSLGSMKTSLAMNLGPDPKPSNGCTTNIPESTINNPNRNIPKPAVSNNGVPNGHFYELTYRFV